MVFTLAIIFSTSTASALTGAVIGLAGALVIAFFIYRLGHKLNLSKFFTVIGCLLMVFAAGLLADTVENLQELGWVRVLDVPMWHTGRILSEDSSFGDVLHSFFGYSDSPRRSSSSSTSRTWRSSSPPSSACGLPCGSAVRVTPAIESRGSGATHLAR